MTIRASTVLMSPIVVFVIILFLSTARAEEVIRLTNGEYRPYHSKDLVHGGMISHIVSEAFALEGVRVEWGYYPWARGFILAKSGKWDGTVPYKRTTEREPHFYWSKNAVYGDVYRFFHLKSFEFNWEEVEELDEIRIGASIGYAYGKAFSEALNSGKIDVELIPSDEANFRKLLSGRIQIFPITEKAGYQLLNEKFRQATRELITHHPKALDDARFYLPLSKKIPENKRFIKLFDRGIKRLRENGRYD